MERCTRQITREQYQRGVQNRGYVVDSDKPQIFTEAERLGYGVYSPMVQEKDGEFYVTYLLGSTCD